MGGTGSRTLWWDWDTPVALGVGYPGGIGTLCWDWDTGIRIFQQHWDTLVAQGHPNETETHPGGTGTLQGHLVWDWDIVTDMPRWDWDTLQREWDTMVILGHPSGPGTPQGDWDTLV